jgi:hypothetical protein
MSTTFEKLTVCGGAKLQSGLLAFCIGISILSRSKHSVTRMTLGCEFHFHSMQRPESIEMHIIKITFSPCSAEPLDLS